MILINNLLTDGFIDYTYFYPTTDPQPNKNFISVRQTLVQIESESGIAEFLMQKNIKGKLDSPGECPISRWMYSQTNDEELAVTNEQMFVSKNGPITRLVRHTEPMLQFIYKFNKGDYPNLIEK